MKVLVIDDNIHDLRAMKEQVQKLDQICLATTNSLRAMEMVIQESPDIIISDQKMPEKDGLTILKEAREYDPNIIVIILTAYGTYSSVLEALRAGAFDYLEKPFAPEQFEVILKRAIKHRNLMLQDSVERPPESRHFDNIVGMSHEVHSLLENVTKMAKFNAHVMIYGESGTGKELIARSIHAHSPRAGKSFVPLDCVALPPNLLESELFGYEKGAFTGANHMRRGLLEYANDGSLFLDEICELDVNLQAKLLRVLQQQEFRRVGGKEMIKVDVRIISATNRNPEKAVEQGLLREDLYYRLNVIPLTVPPLRERREDIVLLVEHFLERYCRTNGLTRKRVSPAALEALKDYGWPGNVRELQNLVERLVSMIDHDEIEPSDLPDYIALGLAPNQRRLSDNGFGNFSTLPFLEAKKRGLEELERRYFETLLTKCDGNISKVAEAAGVSRPTVYRIIKTYELFDLT